MADETELRAGARGHRVHGAVHKRAAPVARPESQTDHRVVIVHRFVHHYRVPFYEGLADALAERGVALTLVHGVPHGAEAQRNEHVVVPWAAQVGYREIGVAGRSLAWQPALPHVRGADLVIVAQEVKLLLNHLLLARYLLGRERMAFWGHGVNFQRSSASGPGESLKRFVSTRVHWWFAYNHLGGRDRRRLRVPARADHRRPQQHRPRRAGTATATPSPPRRSPGRSRRRVCTGASSRSSPAGCTRRSGSTFSWTPRTAIHAAEEDFELVVVGGGAQEEFVRAAAAGRPWLHATGPLFGPELVRWLVAGKLLLMPGLVGLVVLDSFAMQLPLVTIADSEHSPEFAYLRDGENGVVLPVGTDAAGYADAVVRLLRDEALRARLVEGCQQAQAQYSIEEMVDRFTDGVVRALAAPPLQARVTTHLGTRPIDHEASFS